MAVAKEQLTQSNSVVWGTIVKEMALASAIGWPRRARIRPDISRITDEQGSSKCTWGLRPRRSSLQVFCAPCFDEGAVLAFLAGGISPKTQNKNNKAKQSIALQQGNAHCTKAKESTQGNPNRAQGFIAMSYSVLQYTCELHKERQMWNDDDVVAWRSQRWRCDLWHLHANGVGHPGVQFDMLLLARSVICQRRQCLAGWISS
jgi:hypothetical protein